MQQQRSTRYLPRAAAMGSSKAGNGVDLIGDRIGGNTTGDTGIWAREEVNRAGRNRYHAPHEKKFASGSTLGKYQVNYAKPLEMTYF